MTFSKVFRAVLLGAFLSLLGTGAEATSYQYQTVNLQTGQVLPGALVTVYDFGTTNRSTIRKTDGTPQSNPFISDSNGIGAFAGDNAAYQTIWSQGNYVSPLWSLTTGGAIPVVGIGTVSTTACNTPPTAMMAGSSTNPLINLTFPACTYSTANLNPGIPLILQGNPGGSTYATAAYPLTINRSNAAFDTGLVINVPQAGGGVSSQAYSAIDIYMGDSSGKGEALRIFDARTSPPQVSHWFDVGGFWTSVNINLCTIRQGSPTNGINQTLGCQTPSPGSSGAALNVLNDTIGPAASFGIINQDAIPGVFNTDWRDGSGAFVAGIGPDGSLGFGTYRGTVNYSNLDTWIGHGNLPALLQVGGRDNATGTAQALAAPSVTAPVTLRALPSAAGQNVLQYRYDLDGQVPLSITAGMTVTDTETPTAIPGGTTVSAPNPASGTITLSANIAGSGVQLNDHMVFSWPNHAGADLAIAGGRGTGTGAGGKLILSYAPAGGAGNGQNGWTPAVKIGDPGASAPVDVQTAINAASYKSGGTAGVSCSGSPTGSFAVVNGIVTHC